MKTLSGLAILLVIGLSQSACTEQHDPSGHWQQLKQERQQANQPTAKLSGSGELLTGAAAAGGKTAAENYATFCANCHGAEGKGDGPGSGTQPPPRNLADVAWQNSTTNENIAKVIREGGPAIGLSAIMAPWGAVLKESEIQDMVAYVRDLKQ